MSSVSKSAQILNTNSLGQHQLSTIEGCLYKVLFQTLQVHHLWQLTVVGLVWQEPDLSGLEAKTVPAVPGLLRQHCLLYTNL